MRAWVAASVLLFGVRGAHAKEGDAQVTVRGQRPRDAASEVRLDAAVLAASSARSVDDLLRQIPGVLVVQHGAEGKGVELFVRGFDALHGQDVEVLLGDVPLNEPSNVHAHGYLDLAFIIPELVVGIDATKGVARLDQGDFATAASLGLRLGVPAAERGARVVLEAGTTSRLRALALYAPADRPEGDVVGVELMRDPGFGQHRASRRISALGQWGLGRLGGARLEGLAAIYGGWFDLPGALRLEDLPRYPVGGSYNTETGGTSHRALAALTARARAGATRLKATAFAQARALRLDENFTGDLAFPEQGDRHLQTHVAWSGGLRVHATRPLAGGLGLRAFSDAHAHRVDQQIDRLDRDGQPWNRARDLQSTRLAGALGLGLVYAPWEAVELFAGARGDVLREAGTDRGAPRTFEGTTGQLSPRAGLTVTPWAPLKIQAAYGRGLRSPEASAFSEGGVTPTAVDHAELGLRFTRPGLDVGAAVFAIALDDERLFDHAAGVSLGQGASRRRGLEVDADYRPHPAVLLGASFTRTDARFTALDRPVPGVPTWVATARAAYAPARGLGAGLTGVQIGERPLAHGARAGPAAVLSGRLGYRWALCALDLEVENLLDARWREGEFDFASHWDPRAPRSALPVIHVFPGPPRQARLGFTTWF
ncbi:MAG: TonB-dependent receptor [Myxococcales bacterium]|nr:TonB-dependent receptor [Myxococcales bacterium]